MKNLYLLRHSSALHDSKIRDINRPLDKEGIKLCDRIGDFIQEKSLFPQISLCSNSVRTKQTIVTIAQYLNMQFNVHFIEKLYNSNFYILYEIIQSIDNNYNDVLIVGHNPSLSQLVHFLIKDSTEFTFKPGNLACLQIPIDNWRLLQPATSTIQGLFTNEL